MGYRGTAADISQEREAQLTRDQALHAAKEANAAKSEFLATMSHEFRTPLNAILGFSGLFLHQIAGPLGAQKYFEYAEAIHYSGQRMLSLVNDLLDMAAIEAGKRDFKMVPVSLQDRLRLALTEIEPIAEANEISVRSEISENMPMVHADRRSVDQIFANILSNAVKYNKHGGYIMVRSVITDEEVSLVFADSGLGIPQDHINRILEPFAQVKAASETTQEGAGLGLYIVEKLLKAQGAKMAIQSVEGEGTEITLRFRVKKDVAVKSDS